MREETFGPIIGIQKVSGIDEAVKLMNDSDYGLTAGVYTKNSDVANNVLSQVTSFAFSFFLDSDVNSLPFFPSDFFTLTCHHRWHPFSRRWNPVQFTGTAVTEFPRICLGSEENTRD